MPTPQPLPIPIFIHNPVIGGRYSLLDLKLTKTHYHSENWSAENAEAPHPVESLFFYKCKGAWAISQVCVDPYFDDEFAVHIDGDGSPYIYEIS